MEIMYCTTWTCPVRAQYAPKLVYSVLTTVVHELFLLHVNDIGADAIEEVLGVAHHQQDALKLRTSEEQCAMRGGKLLEEMQEK